VCGGSGYTEDQEEMTINIPEGLEEKTKLFVKGKGNYINGSRGDLYVTVEIQPDSRYERIGNDLIMNLEVDVFDVMLEKTITVDSLRGEFSIDLDPTTIYDDVVLPQRGTKTINGNNYGNLIIRLITQIPKLTSEQKNIIGQAK
jgi:DnaJ-class molecular chaperone